MSTERRHPSSPSTGARRRRLTLRESYDPGHGAFGHASLKEISDSIRAISASNQRDLPEETSPRGESQGESPRETHGTPGDHIAVLPGHSPCESLGISPSQSLEHELVILTSNQALLYECAQLLEDRCTILSQIAQAIDISVDTLRSGLHKLRKIG